MRSNMIYSDAIYKQTLQPPTCEQQVMFNRSSATETSFAKINQHTSFATKNYVDLSFPSHLGIRRSEIQCLVKHLNKK